MRVSKLIKQLKKLPADAQVHYKSYSNSDKIALVLSVGERKWQVNNIKPYEVPDAK